MSFTGQQVSDTAHLFPSRPLMPTYLALEREKRKTQPQPVVFETMKDIRLFTSTIVVSFHQNAVKKDGHADGRLGVEIKWCSITWFLGTQLFSFSIKLNVEIMLVIWNYDNDDANFRHRCCWVVHRSERRDIRFLCLPTNLQLSGQFLEN